MPTSNISPTRLSKSIDKTPADQFQQAPKTDATTMPSLRQTSIGIPFLTEAEKKRPEYSSNHSSYLRSVRAAPSVVSTEAFLQARAMNDRVFIHNMAAIKSEQISDLHRETPRFKNQIDILA